ncbi:MAG: hypothetical protein JWR50_2829 [Mucilaginibacter sp.]|nr:hypothetical protein [Mucilaginibacter sp.]
MEAFYFNIGARLSLKVVPETRVYMDGHPILTNLYSIYKDGDSTESSPQDDQQKQGDPNYMGYITFEMPGRVFNYIADGQQDLSREEMEEAVEQISNYRNNPALWKQWHD